MKNIYSSIYIFIVLALSFFNSEGQKIQGTVQHDAGSAKVTVYGMPSINLPANNVFTQASVALSIVDQGAANPTLAQLTITPRILNFIANPVILGSSGALQFPEIYQGRAYYTITFSKTDATTITNWNAGTNNPIVDVTFPSDPSLFDLRLEDQGANGGLVNQQSYWFIATKDLGEIEDPNVPFYGTGAVNNAGTAEQYVPLSLTSAPVNFSNFSATKKDNAALINWQITNENGNTASYEVERSINGISFTKIATIAPKNNGATANSYDLTDNNLSALQNSVVYYRIKQIDKDGKFVYTNIQSVRITASGVLMNVYPNPVKSVANVSIDLTENSPISLNITDALGKDIKHISFTGTKGLNLKPVDMSSLASGSYLFKIQTAGQLKTIPVVKAN